MHIKNIIFGVLLSGAIFQSVSAMWWPISQDDFYCNKLCAQVKKGDCIDQAIKQVQEWLKKGNDQEKAYYLYCALVGQGYEYGPATRAAQAWCCSDNWFFRRTAIFLLQVLVRKGQAYEVALWAVKQELLREALYGDFLINEHVLYLLASLVKKGQAFEFANIVALKWLLPQNRAERHYYHNEENGGALAIYYELEMQGQASDALANAVHEVCQDYDHDYYSDRVQGWALARCMDLVKEGKAFGRMSQVAGAYLLGEHRDDAWRVFEKLFKNGYQFDQHVCLYKLFRKALDRWLNGWPCSNYRLCNALEFYKKLVQRGQACEQAAQAVAELVAYATDLEYEEWDVFKELRIALAEKAFLL